MIRFSKTTPAWRKGNTGYHARMTRRPYDEVLGERSSASKRGSTYWKRVHRCPRELALYEGGLRKADPFTDPLVIGLLIHRALEFYYKALQRGLSGYEAELAAWTAVRPFAEEPGYDEPWENVERMLATYFELYRDNDTTKWKIFAVEETVEFITPGLEFSGRFDAIIERDGMLWGVEHKCNVAATMVTTPTGRVSVGALFAKHADSSFPLRAYDVAQRQFVTAKATIGPNGVEDIWQLTLASGRTLKMTANHPVLTARGWVPAASLRAGDWVASPAQEVWAGTPTGLPAGLVELVGYFLGDGAIGETYRPSFTKKPGAVADRVLALLIAGGWRNPANKMRVDKRSGCWQVDANTAFKGELAAFELAGCRAAEKFIPAQLLNGAVEERRALLGALWSTDGCVNVAAEGARVALIYTTVSQQLGRDVQALLLSLGFDSTVGRATVLYRGARRPYWQVRITGRRTKKAFLKEMYDGVIPAVKYSRAELFAALRRIPTDDDRLVPTAWVGAERLKRAALRVRPERGQTTVEARQLHARGIDATDTLSWSEVASCLISGREMTYAIEVPGPASHITDDIVTHNTARLISEDLLSGYQMDLQIPGYCWLFRKLIAKKGLPPFGGFIVNILTKDKLPKMERVEVCPSKYHLAAFEQSMRAWMTIRATYGAVGHPMTFGNCVGAPRYFSRCDYFDVCHGRPDAHLHQILEEEPPVGFVNVSRLTEGHSSIDPDEVT